ncbi:bifunctional adenosylcobinamide kinase/adenosylcobinamide-phosphate guanylyltransferase [Salipaludibacillus aurantiacus]|uniref:Adenosyl cobinamide kinase/adenosyl cobinamide phosphate guanylyltransferase n=1 Tax=Salipaludibacillus aurantiacus TaxID=1601833 RepID=A0A1H9SGK2_9BACI|nr:bifunctional adenosylcobinamide kinase/adenosylcobinamide-phosphate guanylyltransferase [Salipaludibacillus aurantiacus]SER83349.1 Adenosyl cobinamide kinase/adenosyl cobinamide phosphate guanylyltransferase [Salipaludibacillus aurantiacus]
MQLVTGGAFSGKRRIVKELFNEGSQELSWLSSYNDDRLDNWLHVWQPGAGLVFEGWENWLLEDLRCGEASQLDKLRRKYSKLLTDLVREEERHGGKACLIMLEMGKGIVPAEAEDRALRDLHGWLQQDAAKLSREVYYVWHGLSRRLK